MIAARFPCLAGAIVLLVHAVANAHYGFFRDELYFIICGRHPQWGYVDQPPVVPLLSAATQLFGHSLWLLRIVPAIFAALGAYTTCLLAIELGGGIFAQALATLAFLFSGVLLSFGQKASPDEVGLWTWPLLALLLVRLVRGADERLWLLFGLVAGFSIESKYSVLFLLAALLVGLLLTSERRVIGSRWCAAGAGVALLVALPNFLWQAHYGFPMWQLLRAGQQVKNINVGPVVYLLQQILITHLLLFWVWVAGLVWLIQSRYRFIVYAYGFLIVEMMVLHGKHYYPANVYPILIAAGGVAIEKWTSRMSFARVALVAYCLIAGPLFVPFSLPVLSEPAFIAYQKDVRELLHVKKQVLATERGREASALPGDWADMHGWPEFAAKVKSVYDALPAAERSGAVVFVGNYGEASAIEFFAPDVPVVSGHNQYWLWGPGNITRTTVIDIGGDCGARHHLFDRAVLAARFNAPYTISYETNVPIMVCQKPRQTLESLWPKLRHYD